MNKQKIVTILLTTLLVSFLAAYIPQTGTHQGKILRGAEQKETKRNIPEPTTDRALSGTVHDPILIVGNEDFQANATAEGWAGDGSAGNPYIIDGYDIDCEGDDINGIYIADTTVNFTISNCYLTGASEVGRAGVYLDNVTFGLITGNTFYNNSIAFHGYAEYSIISSNTVVGLSTELAGIRVQFTNHTTIEYNTVNGTANPIHLINARFTEVTGNTMTDLVFNGITMSGSSNNSLSNNICVGATNIGISLLGSHENKLEGNFCNESNSAVYLLASNQNQISNCHFPGNEQGGIVGYSENNSLMRCVFSDNEVYGMKFWSASNSNVISWSEFRNNTAHVIDDENNTMNHNYYDDYFGTDINNDGIGELPYYALTFIDYNPLVYPIAAPTWISTPSDQILEYGDPLDYHLSASCVAPIDDWTVSDTSNFVISDDGMVSNKGTLEVGVYPLQVTVSNIYGFYTSASFDVTVEDTTNPEWITPLDDREYEYGDVIDFQIGAWDLATIDRWEFSDSENFTFTEVTYAGTSMVKVQNASVLASGIYPLTFTVYDTHDNSLDGGFTVTVAEPYQDETTPVWVVSPYDITIEEGVSFYLQVGAWDESGINHWQLSGSSAFSISDDGVITNNSILEVGVYNLEVRAYDPEDNYCSAEFTVTVVEAGIEGPDTTPVTIPDSIGFNMTTIGLGIAIFALILGIGALINSRKGS